MLSASSVVVHLLSHLTTLVRPREVDNGNNEEAEEVDDVSTSEDTMRDAASY